MLPLIDNTGPPGSASVQAVDNGIGDVLRHYIYQQLTADKNKTSITSISGVQCENPEDISKTRTTVTMRLGLNDSSSTDIRKWFIVNVNLFANHARLGNFYVDAEVPGVITDQEAMTSIIFQLLKDHRCYYQTLVDEIDDNEGAISSVESLSSLRCTFKYFAGEITLCKDFEELLAA